MTEKEIWLNYANLHSQHPRSDSEAKVDFYNQNSEFIKRSSKENNPELAVIIPAHNESALISRTLASLNQALKNEDKVNIFIIDNASTDDTSEIAQSFGARIVKESKKGIGQARQTGLESLPLSVKYVLTTDADSIVSLNWLQSHKKALENENVAYTYGKINFFSDKSISLIDRILLFEYSKIADFIHTVKNHSGMIIGGGANAGYKKDIALGCGGYCRDFNRGEDTDLMNRISKHGDIEKIEGIVTTSARRIINKGIFRHGIERFSDNILHCFKIKDLPSVEKYEDYR